MLIACRTHGGDEYKVCSRNLKGGNNLQDLGEDGRIVLEHFLKNRFGRCDWEDIGVDGRITLRWILGK
jgi:hypothetical protein